jgi:RNA-directed DNA polymerase
LSSYSRACDLLHSTLLGAVNKRLREEFAKLQVEINEEKSRIVDLERAESFGVLGSKA